MGDIKQLVPSRRKISILRKEEIAAMLKILSIDNEGYKRITEPKLYDALMQNPKLAEEDLFKPLFKSINDPGSRTNSQEITSPHYLDTGHRYSVLNRRPRMSNTLEIKQESSVGIKKEQLDTQPTADIFQKHYDEIQAQQVSGRGSQTGEHDYDDDDDDDSENSGDEENYTVLGKSISFAFETLENVDEHTRRASRHWTKVLKEQYKNSIKTIQLILSPLVDLISRVRLSLSTISSVNCLFLLIEACLLAIPLVQKHLGTWNTNSELVKQNFEKELIQPDYSVIESSSLISYPIFASLSSFFIASTISTWNPLFFWALFLVTIPVLAAFFFNLTLNYYTKKQQQVYYQLDSQYKSSQSVSKRTRSHTTGYDQNLIISDLVDQDPIVIEPADEFELVIDSPFTIDPLIFAMTRISLIYFFYSFSASSMVSSTFITTSSFAVKSTIGNLPYLHSIFSAVISLYVVSL